MEKPEITIGPPPVKAAYHNEYEMMIEWTVPKLGTVSVRGPRCMTAQEALDRARYLAHTMGWRRPHLREWWRWRDRRYDRVGKNLDGMIVTSIIGKPTIQ